jgi:hypothetical protein
LSLWPSLLARLSTHPGQPSYWPPFWQAKLLGWLLYWCPSWPEGVPLLVPDPWYGAFPLICVVLYLLSWSNIFSRIRAYPISIVI